ncbi:hypothetical protein [Kribbella albertanoniae]|uniref:Uncharacterized protein n=1 Tax=Kribbella albertanoniae TaxID=1266829 RepID=A0A4R4PPE1_9ACTN|nr:hypothetical protein [Kribbella albertanoniae]TDC24036.1 hypothetical protein E1261_27065 [Kribbella albertanoniae]
MTEELPADRLSDDYPVLLGPVRLETRFTETHLLVRVFPDEWSIDKFEKLPTEAEFGAVSAYWTAVWMAGGNQAAVQAAWQQLTTQIAIGRAGWLVGEHDPANPADRPTTTGPILVINSPVALPTADRQPTTTYWTSIWRARGDRGAIRTADFTLLTAVGPDRAEAIRARRPVGIDNIPAGAGDAVTVAFLVLPRPAVFAPFSWARAAEARLLPDRFMFIGYRGDRQVFAFPGASLSQQRLAVSPDPKTPREDQLQIDEHTRELHVPDKLLWLTNFQRAVDLGMGIRIKREGDYADGVDRLVVIGLRTGSTPELEAAELGSLITDQLRSSDAFSFVAQGTPTNNTEERAAGQVSTDAAPAARPALAADAAAKSDGQWYAELLGLDPAQVMAVPNADGTDQQDARAANTALWPATWGNFLATTLHPMLPAAAVEQTRQFFLRSVTGRGPLPAVRIGRQPYGVLPTTAFRKLAWPETDFRSGLKRVVSTIGEDWDRAALDVPHLDTPRQAHQLLLDILALHPSSAEFHQRYSRSAAEILRGASLDVLDELAGPDEIRALLRRLGYAGTDPDVIGRLPLETQYPLLGPLIEDGPLSETKPLRKDYLTWLTTYGGSNLDVIRLEDGLDGNPPAAILYLLLRHALLLGWEDAARQLAARVGIDVPTTDPDFIHIATGSIPSESRYRTLYSRIEAIDPAKTIAEYIPGVLDTATETARLREQLQAIGHLAKLPTAKLERVLTEHLDLATYRLDAWRTGLVTERLAELRYQADGTVKRGVHIGAYGWLDGVKPRNPPLPGKTLTGELAKVFTDDDPRPLREDTTNGGYIHAPSMSHATTAAVLRAGYQANRSATDPETFAINLTSERIRIALSVLDSMRQGQSLGAVLGYRLERGLHDRHTDVELDEFIFSLRQEFPLRTGKLTKAPDGTKIEVLEARNVVDGLELIRKVAPLGPDALYPWGLPKLRQASETQAKMITAEVKKLIDVQDALADLAVAEGTHQALMGNPERASATLDAYAKEGLPPDPAVIRTPRSGHTLTHRFGLNLRTDLDPDDRPTPRGKAEPAVDIWLPDIVPPAGTVQVMVRWKAPDGTPKSRIVSQADLGLAPIDLLWALRPQHEGALTDLDDRILGAVIARDRPRPDAELTIHYTERIPGAVTFFELSPLIDALRTLLTTSRPLRSTDLTPAAGAAVVERSADENVVLDKNRVVAVLESLGELRTRSKAFEDKVTPLLVEPVQRAKLVAQIDSLLSEYAGLGVTASGFGMVRSNWGELSRWRGEVYGEVLAAAKVVHERMKGSLKAADDLLKVYDALPSNTPDDARFRLLLQVERLLLTTSVPASSPLALRTRLRIDRSDFDRRRGEYEALAKTTEPTLSGLLAAIGKLPLAKFDATGIDLTPFEDRIIGTATDLRDRAKTLGEEIDERVKNVAVEIAKYDAAVPGPDRVLAATDALKILLGEDVLVIPEFGVPAGALDQWQNSRDESSQLLAHLPRFAIDDWAHGVARVREKPRWWEQVVLLSDALRGDGGLLGPIFGWREPELTPVQLPYRDEDSWLGLEFKAGYKLDEDKLLYTAHYADRSMDGERYCGLLLDEWTEVIPATTESSGIALNYDGPDSEPPQTMLLVAPPVRTGKWSWSDLVDAVNDTYQLAKVRAVEPAQLDRTAYGQLLPATVLSATRQQITISTDLATGNLRWKAEALGAK